MPLISLDHAKCIAAVTFCGTIWKAVVTAIPSSWAIKRQTFESLKGRNKWTTSCPLTASLMVF